MKCPMSSLGNEARVCVVAVAVGMAICPSAVHEACCDEPVAKPVGFPAKVIHVGIADGEIRGDDHRTLQKAVDRMASPGGGTVRVGPGRYVMRNALMLRSNVRVIGTPGNTSTWDWWATAWATGS